MSISTQRQRVFLSAARWMGLSLCVLIIALFALSHWWGLVYGHPGSSIELVRGNIRYVHDTFMGDELEASDQRAIWAAGIPEAERGWRLRRIQQWGTLTESLSLPYRRTSSMPLVLEPSPSGGQVVLAEHVWLSYRFPLWLLFVIASAPTAFLWYRQWKQRSRMGYCRCGYNLLGNVSGICPECGTPIPEAVRNRLETKETHARTTS
jgi:hypothetical protein